MDANAPDIVSRIVAAREQGSSSELDRMEMTLRGRLFGEDERRIAGRYVLRERLGRGGAGVVYRARDVELARDVAIKFVRAGRGGTTGSSGLAQLRLTREAQAVARLTHPNVIRVFDVGTERDEVFVAMELVEGVDLRGWLERQPRSTREILTVFLAAGEGLAAAHAAQLVHRDFKPGNVIVGNDGRTRVLDFGLAKTTDASSASDASPPSSSIDSASSGMRSGPALLTETGIVMGTPVYMAPEQHRGLPAGPAADQFSYCVALYEALCGVRPFAGHDLATLAAGKSRGDVVPAPPECGVPASLLRVVRRGLSADPDERWPSMSVLLQQLRRPQSGARTKVAAVGGLAVACAAVVMLSMPEPDACTNAGTWLAGAWDDAIRQDSSAAFSASALPYARDTWRRVESTVDARVSDWVAGRYEVCTAGRDDALFDLRMACLDERRRDLSALAALWRVADDHTIAQAAGAAQSLDDAAACRDGDRLRTTAGPPVPANARPRVQAMRDELAVAEAAVHNGEFIRAARLLEPLVDAAEALDHPALLAEVLFHAGDAFERIGEYRRAEALLERAYYLAIDHELHRWAFASAKSLAFVVGVRRQVDERGQLWIRHARAAFARGDLSPLEEAQLLHVAGMIAGRAGRFGDELAALRQAAELADTDGGRDDVELAHILMSLGDALLIAGEYDEAEQVARRAIAVFEQGLGPEHPWVTQGWRILSAVLSERGRHDEAMASARRSVAILEAAGGPALAAALIDLGSCHRRANESAQAGEQFERALKILESSEGDNAENIAVVLNNLGGVATAQADWQGALRWLDRAAAVLESSFGPEDVRIAMPIYNRAAPLAKLGRHEEALADVVRAQALFVAAHGEDHPRLTTILSMRGELETELGHLDDARVHLERAIELGRSQALDPVKIAEMQLKLAMASWPDRARRQPARELADAAVRAIRTHAPEHPELAAFERWVAEHRG